MKPSEMFNSLIAKSVSPVLRAHGLSRRNKTFYFQRMSNWGLIDFQKSTKSDTGKVIFAINIGVVSLRLLKFFSPRDYLSIVRGTRKPNIWQCQWRVRLGHLVSNTDKWWDVSPATNLQALSSEILGHIQDVGLPELQKFIGDDALRDLWLDGRSPSLTDFERLRYLSVLLKVIGPTSKLDVVLRQLQESVEGKPSAQTAKEHIQRLLQEKAE